MSDQNKLVQVYDLDTQQIVTMPAAELAPGMVEATVPGLEGTFWLQASKLKEGPPLHAPFGHKWRKKIELIREWLKDVHLLTYEGWEDKFRRSPNAWQEIGRHVHLCVVFRDIAKKFLLNTAQRKALYEVLSTCLTAPYEHVRQVLAYHDLSKFVVEQAIEQYYGFPALNKEFVKLNPDDFADSAGNVPVPVTRLDEADVLDALTQCDTILGVDCFTREACVFFRQSLLNKATAAAQGEPFWIQLLYDSRANHLPWLRHVITELKGAFHFGEK